MVNVLDPIQFHLFVAWLAYEYVVVVVEFDTHVNKHPTLSCLRLEWISRVPQPTRFQVSLEVGWLPRLW